MIDLRSDTVTQPSAEMRQAMAVAETGDDVYGEDPTVIRLEELAASMTGKEAALFVSSGTQGNLLALLSHCERGDEYIAGNNAHTYRFEAGGGAVLGGIQPQPIAFNERGELEIEAIRQAIKPDDYHFAKTKLVCLENTTAGKVLTLDYLAEFSDFVRSRGLARHLDGARVFNASVKLGVEVKEISQYFDSMSICLSKGLAAPVGSLLVGSNELMLKARRWRKMVGGGMRQAGILAAAGIYALENNIHRLAEDHRHASELAAALAQLSSFRLQSMPETNMVLLDIEAQRFKSLQHYLADNGVKTSTQRWVMHRDVSSNNVDQLIELCRHFDQQA
ncbi:MAG: low-specificity L-threonine aldolase [Proteobacteria bacterium]|nr:low-specificity L-threonine aldolase [Pseudomonadota bacterium]